MNETKRTLREKKFIEAYIENNGNATEAYLTLNPKVKRKNASVYGIRMLEKVSFKVKEFLDKLGLNNLALSQKLKEGLEAVKKVAGAEVPDHNVRVRYLDMAFKLKNTYPGEKGKPEEPEDVTVKVTIPKEEETAVIIEKLFSEINKLVESRIKNRDKYKKFIDDDGKEDRSEMQKLADRLISLHSKGDQNYD